jgi:glycosyltransferase involved in cell wall biosynthesis
MADNALGERLGRAGRTRAEQYFSWEAIAHKTHSLYVDVVQNHKRCEAK